MHALLIRILTCAAFMALALAAPAACQARGVRRWSDLNSHPRIIRYDPDKDLLRRQSSVLTKPLGDPPGGKESYSGNRLRQNRFIGKPGRGGIYDAFQEYQKKIGADPKNYKYRLR